eukprot:288007-Chlamydomonas_euryale.AAC.1
MQAWGSRGPRGTWGGRGSWRRPGQMGKRSKGKSGREKTGDDVGLREERERRESDAGRDSDAGR